MERRANRWLLAARKANLKAHYVLSLAVRSTLSVRPSIRALMQTGCRFCKLTAHNGGFVSLEGTNVLPELTPIFPTNPLSHRAARK